MDTQGDRADCHAGPAAMGTAAAEDPVRQNHAANSAQDCGERLCRTWRHLDPDGSGRGHRSGGQPPESLTMETRIAMPRIMMATDMNAALPPGRRFGLPLSDIELVGTTDSMHPVAGAELSTQAFDVMLHRHFAE